MTSKFKDRLLSVKPEPLMPLDIGILQVNLGYRCNMACKHCHVNGGPARTESHERLATIRGPMSERLQISMDRGQLERAIDTLVEQLTHRRLPGASGPKLLPS